MAASGANGSRSAGLFDGSARALARRPGAVARHRQSGQRGAERKARAEHDHGAAAPRAVSRLRGSPDFAEAGGAGTQADGCVAPNISRLGRKTITRTKPNSVSVTVPPGAAAFALSVPAARALT